MATVIATAISNGFSGPKTLIPKYESDYNKFINFYPFQKNSSPKLPGHPIEPSRLSLKRRGVYPVRASVAKDIKTPTDLSQEHGKAERSILVIDNYDSFTYNLCQYLGDLGAMFDVYRNDDLTLEEVKEKNPRGILISPGPGTPRDSGISLQTVVQLGPTVPLFGVCMGLQCMGEAFGGKVVRSPYGVMHGKKSLIYYDEKGEDGILAGLPNPFIAGRYHSLVVDEKSFPHNELEITAWTEDGLIMAARHKKYRHIQGVQFHPESIITSEGKQIVRNFISMVERLEQKSSL